MGHGKETPRQKMIGMMYLVLTALLALNVSKDVLDAFIIVNDGLMATNQSFKSKSHFIYNEIEKQATLNEAKAGPIKKAADDVKHWTEEIFEEVEHLKKMIIIKTDKVDEAAGDTLAKKIKYVKSKDNYDVPTHELLGNDVRELEKYPAHDLKNKLDEYRENLLSVFARDGITLIDEENVIKQMGDLGIDTKGDPHAGDDHPEQKYWEYKKFYHTPILATITVLTQIQSEILNAEALIVEKLYSSISASDFKFNTLDAIVIPNTDYVLRGNNFEAQVFLAAYDTTKKPDILVGRYTEKDGSYEMAGNYTELDVDNQNRGIYRNKETSVGQRIFQGIIQLVAPTGEVRKFPFKKEYQVAQPNLVVSPTKMNVFYVAIENPVKISIPGVQEIEARINNGRIREKGNEFIVTPNRAGKATISVFAKIDNTLKPMGTEEFRVKNVPDPEPILGGKKRGKIKKGLLTALPGIYAVMPEWFDFDLKFTVTEFTVSYTDKGGFVVEERSTSNKFTDAQKNLFQKLNRNSKFYIEDIKAVGPDGGTRPLTTMNFKID